MLGQFHPRCPEPAARNPGFLVSRSPVPMFAISWMAFHDILFPHHKPAWFAQYAERFGRRYRSRPNVEPLFLDLFHRAAEQHGLPVADIQARHRVALNE
jgi:hypothetical protein